MIHFQRIGPRAMRVGLIMLAALMLRLPAAARQSVGDSEEAATRQVVDRYMLPLLRQHGAPGAIVAVSTHGRRYYFSYGRATDDGRPFTPTTLVEIGSCTKVFTTTLFALAISRHQILPDDSAQASMPQGFVLQPAARQMTPRELADFTSGMPDEPSNLPRTLEARSIAHYTRRDFLSWVSRWRPAAPPPAPYLYSNAGIGLLGYLLEDAVAKPWRMQVNDEITRPLGMIDTVPRINEQQRQRLAMGHRANNGAAAPPWPMFAWFAAGVLRSTARDMLSFGEANLGHAIVGGQTIPGELTSAMMTAQTPLYILPSGKLKQGLAWVTNVGDGSVAPEVLKNGGTVGFSTVILVNHANDTAIFIAVNKSQSEPTPIAVEIGRHLR